MRRFLIAVGLVASVAGHGACAPAVMSAGAGIVTEAVRILVQVKCSGSVPEQIKARLAEAAMNKLKALGRKVVDVDSGDDVETLTVAVEGVDGNGDGVADDYTVHTELEDHDGDGRGEGGGEENADDEEELFGDVDALVTKQVEWLSSRGR